MTRIGLWLVVVLALVVSGCAGSLERARADGALLAAGAAEPDPGAAAARVERCERLDRQHRTWGAVAKGAAVLAGASGLSTLPVEDQEARAALAAGAITAGAAAAAAVAMSEGAAKSWARDCFAGGGG